MSISNGMIFSGGITILLHVNLICCSRPVTINYVFPRIPHRHDPLPSPPPQRVSRRGDDDPPYHFGGACVGINIFCNERHVVSRTGRTIDAGGMPMHSNSPIAIVLGVWVMPGTHVGNADRSREKLGDLS